MSPVALFADRLKEEELREFEDKALIRGGRRQARLRHRLWLLPTRVQDYSFGKIIYRLLASPGIRMMEGHDQW